MIKLALKSSISIEIAQQLNIAVDFGTFPTSLLSDLSSLPRFLQTQLLTVHCQRWVSLFGAFTVSASAN